MANPFAGDVAARYHAGRPRHHERTLRRAGIAGPGLALDVAGGTGLSTSALAALGFDAVCIDVSASMLALAPSPKVRARAEALPFLDGCASVVTVSSGVHWFDQEAFFAGARRVLRPDGHLVLYEHGMRGVDGWSGEEYRARYPTPPRGDYAGAIEPVGFTKARAEAFTEPIAMSQRELVDYLLTQSNTIGPVERGEQTIESIDEWLVSHTASLFSDDEVRDVEFWAVIDVWAPA